MQIYLEFNSEAEAKENNDTIWCNFLISHASNEEKLVGNGAGTNYFLSDIENMTHEQLCPLKSYGKKDGFIQDSDGLTIAWSTPHEEYNNPGKWVIEKPDESLMTGVTGHTEVEHNPEWWPPQINP